MFVNWLQSRLVLQQKLVEKTQRYFLLNRNYNTKLSFEVTQRLWLLFKMAKAAWKSFIFCLCMSSSPLAAILTRRRVLT